MLIKTLFEFARFFKLQNVAKKSNSFKYKLEGALCVLGHLKPDLFFVVVVYR